MTPALTIPSRDERLGSARSAAMESVKNDPILSKAFANLTPYQKSLGKLVGKLMEKGRGNKQVDDAFAWWEQEHNKGEPLDLAQKNIVLLEAIGSVTMGGGDENYRNLRKVFVALNQ